jgi:hypothetical protein
MKRVTRAAFMKRVTRAAFMSERIAHASAAQWQPVHGAVCEVLPAQ